MEIAYHIGVNATDGDRIMRSLMRSADRLTDAAISLPGPGRYRKLLRESVASLLEAPPAPGTRDALIDAINELPEAQRLVLSNANFFCHPNRIFEGGAFYAMAAFKTAAFRQLFPNDQLEIHMAIRNPATFIPAVFEQARMRHLVHFLNDIEVNAISWSDVVRRMRQAAPDIPITLWCNEDTPLIWNDILHRLSGLPAEVVMDGAQDMVEAVMQPEGFQRYLAYLAAHPPASPEQARRVIGAFLEKYAITTEIEQVIDLPDWDDDLVHELTEDYEADLAVIAEIEGVTFLTP